MANYIYSKVKEALGGSRMGSSSKTVIKDWTPNGVKALVICRSFIIVAISFRFIRGNKRFAG